MASLTREQVMERARAVQIERAPLFVKEMGGEIWVRGRSAKEQDKFEESLRIKNGKKQGQNDLKDFRAKLAVRVIVNEEGERLFNDSEQDVAMLSKFGMVVIDRILAKSTELSGSSDEEADALGEDSASAAVVDEPTSPSPEN